MPAPERDIMIIGKILKYCTEIEEAHQYGNIDTAIVWETATENIIQVKEFCENLLS